MRDLRPRTCRTYGSHVRLLSEHCQEDPYNLVEDQLRDYFFFLRQEKDYKPSSMNQAKVALRVDYNDYLRLDPPWRVSDEVIVCHRESLPLILSREGVCLVLGELTEPKFISCLSLTYSCGLWLSEATAIEVTDIDRTHNRSHVHKGKGGKARFVLISDEM